MDPLFLYSRPHLQLQTHQVNNCSPKISTSPIFNSPKEEPDDTFSIITPLANNFPRLSLNVSPQQDAVPTPRYCFPPLMPFPAEELPSYLPTPQQMVPINAAQSKSLHFSNVFSENEEKNPCTYTGSPLTNGGFLSPIQNDISNVDIKAFDNIPTFIPAREKQKLSNAKVQDLSVAVPEFVPRSVAKSDDDNAPIFKPIANTVNLLNSDESSFMQSTDNADVESNVTRNEMATYQENVNGTTYFYAAPLPTAAPLPSNLVIGTSITHHTSNTISITSSGTYPSSFTRPIDVPFKRIPNERVIPYFIPAGPPQGLIFGQPVYGPLPEKVACYSNLSPLETISGMPSRSLPIYVSTMYKAVHSKSGHAHCLRRIHDATLPSTKCNNVIGMWKKLNHSNLVKLIDMFVTTEFGDNSIVFVYDYFEKCESFSTKYFPPQTENLNGYMDTFSSDPNAPRPYSHTKNALLRQLHSNVRLPEASLWGYFIQLAGALKVIHNAGLSCRCIDPTKIIVTGENRIRIGGTAVSDIMLYDHCLTNRTATTTLLQQEDLIALGKVLLALACGSSFAIHRENIETSLDVMSRTYSKDLKNLIETLLAKTNKKRSISEFMPLVGLRFFKQIDAMQSHYDSLQNEISKEVNSKKLLMLVIKLDIINERLSSKTDATLGKNVNNPLVLFKEYLYKQVTEDQRLCFSMPRIMQCLNKFDAASLEKICLMKDDNSPMIMSYQEIKKYFDCAFKDLSYEAVYIDEETDTVEVPLSKN